MRKGINGSKRKGERKMIYTINYLEEGQYVQPEGENVNGKYAIVKIDAETGDKYDANTNDEPLPSEIVAVSDIEEDHLA